MHVSVYVSMCARICMFCKCVTLIRVCCIGAHARRSDARANASVFFLLQTGLAIPCCTLSSCCRHDVYMFFGAATLLVLADQVKTALGEMALLGNHGLLGNRVKAWVVPPRASTYVSLLSCCTSGARVACRKHSLRRRSVPA